MITNYTIVCDSYARGCFDEVKRLIREGWQPIGGVSKDGYSFAQAMVKYEKDNYEKD